MRISDWSSDVCSSDLLRQTNRHIDGNLGFDQQQTKRVVIRNQFTSFHLAICDCFAISCHHVRTVFLPTRLIRHRLDAIPVGVDDIFYFDPKNDLLPPLVTMSGFVYKPHSLPPNISLRSVELREGKEWVW